MSFGLSVSKACRAALLAALLPLILIGSSAVAHAQAGTGGVAGVVLDPDAKAVVSAGIVVRNEATNDVRTTTTDASGRFLVSGLVPGVYTVEVGVPGFDLVRKTSIQVTADKPMETSIQLSIANIAESVTVSTALPAAAAAAPSQGSLTARSAESLISNEYIRNYTSPFSDYSQVLQMAPGTFSVSANGPGLSDTKTFFRGFPDGFYSMTFDGIPFNDTNDPTHHSWVFFPAQTIGSTVFERSPGSAASIGPSTYGGSVNLLSQPMPAQQTLSGTVSYGSFNTRLFDAQFDSGQLGAEGKSRLLIEGHQTQSDGYQTFNDIKTDAFSAKYQYTANDHTVLTAFSSIENMHSNTPNQKGATRAQIAANGDNFLMTSDPASPLYFGYNFYNVPTNFEYVGLKSTLGSGWSIDDKVYTMRYHNQQNYNSVTTISATSGVDKLNSYWKVGNFLPVSYVSSHGIFRTGLWTEYASTDRHQTPADPRTWVDAALPNFHEMFGTTSLQPFAEYGLKVGSNLTITPGVKFAYYKQDFTQFADNGKVVGNLGGAPSIQHAVEYHSWLPSVDAHYLIQSSWSVYGQYGKGQNIPPTSIFDVAGALVATLPKPVLSDTFQAGSVWKANRATLDVDVYHIVLQNAYSATFDPVAGDTLYFQTANTTSKGVESESTILLGGGLAIYLNGTLGSAKYADTGLSVQNTPSDTETAGLTYNRGSWNMGLFSKRVGKMYNDNGNTHQAVAIDPFNITNMFVNYSVGGSSVLAQSKIRFAVNNLTDSHALTGVSPASTATSAPAAGDVLTLMSGRSVSVSLTVGLSPRRP
jgi:iron complex outermembrane recepter protein